MSGHRSAVGRAELVRIFAAQGRRSTAAAAGMLGFEPVLLDPQVPAWGEFDWGETPPAAELVPPAEKLNFAPIPFLRVVKVEYRAEGAKQERTPIPVVDLDPPRKQSRPPSPPLVAWPRLWRVLEDFVRAPQEGSRIDALRLVDQVARGRVIRRLPRRWLPAAGQVRLILDWSRHLVPFRSDQSALESELRRRLGPYRLRIEFLGPEGPLGLAAGQQADDERVVAVSDLGFLEEARSEIRQAWARLGERLRQAGSRLMALVPCPPDRWEPGLADLWNAVEWENPRPNASAVRRSESDHRARRRESLLRLIAPAIRVEPGLLRELRQLLGREADAGTEADVWHLFPNPSSVAATPPAGAEWRQRLAREPLSPDLESRVVKVLRRWREALPPLVLAEELTSHLSARALSESQRLEMREVLRFACEQVRTHGKAGAQAVTGWFNRWSSRMAMAPEDPELRQAVVEAWRTLKAENRDLPLPHWAGPELLATLGPEGKVRDFEIWQKSGEILLKLKGNLAAGSLLGSLRSSGRTIQVCVKSLEQAITKGNSVAWLAERDHGDRTFQLEIDATGVGAFSIADLPHRLRLVSNLEAVELQADARPFWASRVGRDQYGFWAALEIGEVFQRLRYIAPGRFAMGSPEAEMGRWENEGPQNVVTLAEGFWLADTPCTQEFWQVLMPVNPSRFQTPRRPVEQVSLSDVQIFLKELQDRLGNGVEAQLPSEAQWEYACRAGTTTSTYAGELKVVGEYNGSLLDEIAWYGGNSGLKFEIAADYGSLAWPDQRHGSVGTRMVGLKRPNAWGLFDMLGNVWEWCAENCAGGATGEGNGDSLGSPLGSSGLVRGGSWFNSARTIRAACREKCEPGFRGGSVGFRFSLGSHA